MSSSGALQNAGPALPVAQITNNRFFPQASSAIAPSVSSALVNGRLRLSPGWIPNQITIAQLGAEVATIGDIGSTFLIAVYRDAGVANFPYPGTLVSSGQIAGDLAAVQEIDVTDFVLTPGWWHFGGVVQNVTVTQPTMRSHASAGINGLVSGSAPGVGASLVAYFTDAVTGVAPPTFPAYANNAASISPRIHLRLA